MRNPLGLSESRTLEGNPRTLRYKISPGRLISLRDTVFERAMRVFRQPPSGPVNLDSEGRRNQRLGRRLALPLLVSDLGLFWVLGIALLARIAYVAAYLTDVPYALFPINDAEIAWERAGLILERGILLTGTGPFYQPPLYPYLLAPARWLFGDHPLAMILVQQSVGLLNILLTWRLAVRLGGRRHAWIPALIFGLAWPVLAYETKLVAATLCTTSILILLNVLLIRDSRPWWLRSVAAGVVLGGAVLLRPNLLLLAPLVWVWLWLFEIDRRPYRIEVLIVICAAVLAILPVTLRNITVGGDRVLLCANGGVTFYMGNNGHAAGGLGQAPDIPTNIRGQSEADTRRASELAGRELLPSEASSFWYQRALSWAANNPVAYAALMAKKAFLTLLGRGPGVSYDVANELEVLRESRGVNHVWRALRVPFALGLASGWFALFGGRWWRERIPALLTLPVLAALGVSLLFYASIRFLVPVLPCMVVLGWWRLKPMGLGWRSWSSRFGVVTAAVILLAFPASWVEGVLASGQPHYRPEVFQAVTAFNLGVSYERQQSPDRAEASYVRSLKLDPDHAGAVRNLGALLGRSQRYEEAEEVLRDGLERHPRHAGIAFNLATTYYRTGKTSEALETLDTLLDQHPNHAGAARMRRDILQARRVP